jgi:hypothetical protein
VILRLFLDGDGIGNTRVFCCCLPIASRIVTETQEQILYYCLFKNLGRLFYNHHLHPLSGPDNISGESWMVLTAIHGEGDGLVLCEVMTALILVMLVLVLLELTQQVLSKCCCGVFSAISSSQHHV